MVLKAEHAEDVAYIIDEEMHSLRGELSADDKWAQSWEICLSMQRHKEALKDYADFCDVEYEIQAKLETRARLAQSERELQVRSMDFGYLT